MFLLTNLRALCALTVIASVSLLGAAYYFELVMELEPCPMCIMQRIVVLAIGLIALIALVHNPKSFTGKKVYASLAGLTSLAGIAISIRHSWIQAFPPEDIPSCGAPLEYMIEIMPFQEVLTAMLSGTASCTDVSWNFLGLTMPNWMIIVFICYGIFSALLWRSKNVDKSL